MLVEATMRLSDGGDVRSVERELKRNKGHDLVAMGGSGAC